MVKKVSLSQVLEDESYLPFRQTSREVTREPRYRVRVLSVSGPVPHTWVLTLERPKDFIFKPGQYLWLVLPARSSQSGKIDRRAYSIASGTEDQTLEIVIRLTGSEYVLALQSLKKGALVDIIGPFGSVFVPPKEGAVMIAGGTGIAPFLSVVRTKPSGAFSLYAFASEGRPFHCREELQEWGKGGKQQVSLLLNVPKAEDFAALGKMADTRPIFISGPQGFVTAIAEILKRRGVAAKRMRYEASYPVVEEEEEMVKIFSSIDDLGLIAKEADFFNQVTSPQYPDPLTVWKKTARRLLTRVFLPILILLVAFSGAEIYFKQGRIPWVHLAAVVAFMIVAAVRVLFRRQEERTGVVVVIVALCMFFLMRVEQFSVSSVPLWLVTFPLFTRFFLSSRKSLFFNIFYIVLLSYLEWGISIGIVPLRPLADALQYIFILIFIAAMMQLMSWLEEEYVNNTRTQLLEQETLLKELRQFLRLSQMFTLISEQTSNHVIVTDHRGVVVYANKAAERLTGYTFKEMRWQTPRLWGGMMPWDHYQKLWDRKEHGEAVSHEFTNRRKDGRLYTALGRITPLKRNGRVIAYVATEEDISHLKEIDRAKTEFVSLASHQLRTPLTAIGWCTEMLLAGDAGALTNEQKHYLEEIHQGNRRMTELVSALLNVSRLELGTFAIELVPTDVIAVGRSVIDEIAPHAKKKHLHLVKDFSEHIPIVQADPKLLHMIYQNLLSNAVKYTPEGGEVGFSLSIDEKENVLTCRVTDSGWGIPIDQQPKVFTKLFRADNIRDKDVDGTGLGLYIVKSVVEQAGGKIWFESVENKGSTFSVTFPLAGMKKQTSMPVSEYG